MPMFNGREGEYIDIEPAQTMVQAHRVNGEINAVFFGKEKLQEMLNQAGSVGLRMYFARTEANNETLVIAAANADGEDIMSLLLDDGVPCPNDCDYASLLMR